MRSCQSGKRFLNTHTCLPLTFRASASPSAGTTCYRLGRWVSSSSESSRYVRSYPQELPVLGELLPGIQTPVQLIFSRRDDLVPPINGEYLHERLPNSKLDILDTGHYAWEDVADQYAAIILAWIMGGYRNTRV